MGQLALSLRASGDAWLRRYLRGGLLPRPCRPLFLAREAVGTLALPGEVGEGEAGDGGILSFPTAGGVETDSAEVTRGSGLGESVTTGDADLVELAA